MAQGSEHEKWMSTTWKNNKSIVIQVIAMLIAFIGIIIASDRRITNIELQSKYEHESRIMVESNIIESIKKIQDTQSKIAESVVRLTAIVNSIEERHRIEDMNRK